MNNKNFKLITIDGITGIILLLLLSILAIVLLFALPILAITEIWNYIIGYYFAGPVINYFLASLLWLAGILTIYAILRSTIKFSFKHIESDNNQELNDFLEQISDKEGISDEDLKKFEEILNNKKEQN